MKWNENAPKGYLTGVNLGGWISQFGKKGKDHWDSFVTENTIAKVKELGFDHVRVPVDDQLIESAPFVPNEEGLAYIDNCLAWCKKHGLNMILDLHAAPGYSFSTLEENSLFDDPVKMDRFVWIWEMFAKRYIEEGDNLLLELVNEMVEPDSSRWNPLAHRTVKAIRAIDKTRWIVFGGNNYNAVFELKNIDLIPDDEHILYNFHFYEPLPFTHQRASWNKLLATYTASLDIFYPGEFTDVEAFLATKPEGNVAEVERCVGHKNDKEYLYSRLQPALDFMQATGKPVYCGEYGVIDAAPADSRVNWAKDMTDWFLEHNIGRAVWSLHKMNFGLIGTEHEGFHVIDKEFLHQVARSE